MNTFTYTDHFVTDSSFAEEAFYNGDTGVMVINTTSGDSLTYNDVPEDAWTGFTESSSAGAFYAREIRGNYPYDPTVEWGTFVDKERTPEVPEVPSPSDDGAGFRYGVTAYFSNLEDAVTLFSYAEGSSGGSVTLTAFNLDED